MILERLGKCVEALDVIRGPLGGMCVCVRFSVCVLVKALKYVKDLAMFHDSQGKIDNRML